MNANRAFLKWNFIQRAATAHEWPSALRGKWSVSHKMCCATDCFLFPRKRRRGEKERETRFLVLLHFRWVQMHTHSSAIRGQSIFIITVVHWNSHQPCVIFMPHLGTPSEHPHPTASRHLLLSCIPSWFLVMFAAACDTEAVGGLPSLSFFKQHPLPMQHQWLSLLSSILHLTHTNKPTHTQTTHSTHAKHMPTVTLLSHTHKYMQTQLKPTHSHWPLNPFRSLERIN